MVILRWPVSCPCHTRHILTVHNTIPWACCQDSVLRLYHYRSHPTDQPPVPLTFTLHMDVAYLFLCLRVSFPLTPSPQLSASSSGKGKGRYRYTRDVWKANTMRP